MKLAYVTDLHGNREALEKTLEIAERENVSAIIIGGDLTPTSVMIKLAEFPDPDQDRESKVRDGVRMKGGEILPLDMLRRDPHTKTYTRSLEGIATLNERFGVEKFGEHFERRGAILHCNRNAYYDLESMLLEQWLLDKLFNFFRQLASGVQRPALELSEEEIDMVRDCVVEWFKEFEANWDEKGKKNWIAQCTPIFNLSRSLEFAECAPSRMIEDCILFGLDPQMHLKLEPVEKLAQEQGAPFARFLRKSMTSVKDRLIRASLYARLIKESDITLLVPYSSIARLEKEAVQAKGLDEGQVRFLREYAVPLLTKWKSSHPSVQIYVMLGNDDTPEAVAVLEAAEANGTVIYLNQKIYTLSDGLSIVGYSFVDSLPTEVEQRAWVKEPDEVMVDLKELTTRLAGRQAVWVIHQPPFGILDQTEHGPAGSRAVLRLIKEVQPPLALFGHIHEAPRLGRSVEVKLGATRCINPGGEHGDNVQIAIIDTEVQLITGGPEDEDVLGFKA
jgi:Icc-related predicted phosphoesterase